MSAHNFIDLTGQTFGRLTVVGRAESKQKSARWHCSCVCGGTTTTEGTNLRKGHTTSCGCYWKEQRLASVTKHGMAKTTEYNIWMDIRSRVGNPMNPAYKNYGGRGISIDPSWDTFAVFLSDMGPRPKGHSIDRLDNNLGYFKANCYWATRKQQANNKRNNVLISYKGITRNITQWAENLGMNTTTLHNRVHVLNWSIEKALTTPIRGH